MRAFLAAMLAMALIAVGAYYALHEAGLSSAEVRSGESVRLGD
jgi:hypothetical protein